MTAVPCAVLLAAGVGSRLGDDPTRPKPLLALAGTSIGERAVMRLTDAGIDRFVVVVGYQAERVRAHFEDVAGRHRCALTVVHAADWALGNGASAAVAEAAAGGEPFLLAMIDHLFAPGMVERMLAAAPGPDQVLLGIDRAVDRVFDLDDLTKVALDGDRITAIGKELGAYDAGDTGLFYATPALFAGLAAAREEQRYSLSDGVRKCIALRRMGAVDLTGFDWLDVDTPAAFREAERRLAAF